MGSRTARTHGAHRVAVIESDAVLVAVVPDFGAKVIALTDKRTGRNWLTTGEPTDSAADDAIFGGRQSYGWDECFPTIAIRNEAMPGWRDQPRDHGMLWGRPWQVDTDGGTISTAYGHPDFVFQRSLAVSGATVTATYSVESRSDTARPYLWSAHPTFAFRPGETIELPGVDRLDATYIHLGEKTPAPQSLAWPIADIGGRLDTVRGVDARLAMKLYATGDRPDTAAVSGAAGRLVMRWQRPEVAAFGLWLDYGGWPDEDPIHQVALEPTTSPDDDIWSAVDHRRAAMLPARGRVSWSMTIALEPGHADSPLNSQAPAPAS